MVSFRAFAALAIAASPLLQTASAHPGEVRSSLSFKRQAALHEHLAARGAEKLARCADSLKAREVKKRTLTRRAAKVDALKRQVLAKRDSTEIEAYDVSHNYTGSISQNDVFSTNASCILEPQLTIGPYWVSGELIRQDDTEDQEGVNLSLELEFIDVNTCEPVSGLYIDKWHANSTGVYSGVKESSLDSTYLRAIQITDDDGVVTFETLVPGHYDGRATHTHIMVHENVTAYDNNTYSGGTVRSISQLFYDTALRAAVEAVEPYSSNTNAVTTDEEDSLLSAVTLGDYDPFVKYIYLGDDISDGIFAWHSIGIDISADYTSNESAASAYYETGGVDESGSSSFGGSGGSGGAPSGSTNGTGPGGSAASFNGTGMPSNSSGVVASGSNVVVATGSPSTTSGTASRTSTTYAATTAVSNSGAAATKGSWFWKESKTSRSVQRAEQAPSNVSGGDRPLQSAGAASSEQPEGGPIASHTGLPPTGLSTGFLTLPSHAIGRASTEKPETHHSSRA